MSIVMFGVPFLLVTRICISFYNILGILKLDLVAAAKLRSAAAELGLGYLFFQIIVVYVVKRWDLTRFGLRQTLNHYISMNPSINNA